MNCDIEIGSSNRGEKYRQQEGSLLRPAIVFALLIRWQVAVAFSHGADIVQTHETILAHAKSGFWIAKDEFIGDGIVPIFIREAVLVFRAGSKRYLSHGTLLWSAVLPLLPQVGLWWPPTEGTGLDSCVNNYIVHSMQIIRDGKNMRE